MTKNIKGNIDNKDWKEKNKNYLKELQNFFDKADNIEDNNLKQKIIGQMLKCDDILTKIAESRFEEFYKLGYKNAKKNKIYLYIHTNIESVVYNEKSTNRNNCGNY